VTAPGVPGLALFYPGAGAVALFFSPAGPDRVVKNPAPPCAESAPARREARQGLGVTKCPWGDIPEAPQLSQRLPRL